jgi:DNA polymerase III epsilon subunit-like protein
MAKHVSFDLETLGTTAGCIVLSIGAVVFDEKKILQEFEVHIDPVDSEKHGLTCQAGTAMWWLSQSEEARRTILDAPQITLNDALDRLNAAFDWTQIENVWCNGAAFDFPILNAAFKAVGKTRGPWPFWQEMDLRTLLNLLSKPQRTAVRVSPTIAHSALADARAQAETIQRLLFMKNASIKVAA